MIKSATMARCPDIFNWKNDWAEVLQVIKKRNPELVNLKADEKLINETLEKGEVVMHHSKHFENTYHPHYRIIDRTILERWMKTFLSEKINK